MGSHLPVLSHGTGVARQEMMLHMGMTLGIIIEKRNTACSPWETVMVDGLLAHRQFRRLSLVAVVTECLVYTLAAPTAMAELLRGGVGAEIICTPLQEGTGLPEDASAACRRDFEALAQPSQHSAGWFTNARLQHYDWDAGRRELLDDELNQSGPAQDAHSQPDRA